MLLQSESHTPLLPGCGQRRPRSSHRQVLVYRPQIRTDELQRHPGANELDFQAIAESDALEERLEIVEAVVPALQDPQKEVHFGWGRYHQPGRWTHVPERSVAGDPATG